MAESTRNRRVAIKVETTEGTPVAPTAATDYIASQDDFAMEPAFENLDNAEIRASIGPSKSIVGLENPTASFSHYLRHSGVEGQAPNYSDLVQAVFGAEEVEGTEYDTVAGSTTTVVNVDSGEGVNFQRGQPLLIKDGANGYSIRPIQSISTDALTLGFALSSAPASGVDLGKAVLYYPANEDHQTLTLWHYVGNGGAVEMMAGSRIVDMSVSASAGELINANYSLEGIAYYWDPIEIESTDTYLDFTDDDSTYAAQISAKFYKDPHQLAAALTTAMNATGTTQTHAVTYNNSTGKFNIANTTGSTLSLLWNTGGNAANTVGDKIGFSVAADDTGATDYDSDNAQSYASPQTPSFDDADPLVAKNQVVFVGDQGDNVCFKPSTVDISISTPKANINDICAESGRSGSVITERAVTVSVTALLEQYDADKFRRMRENSDTRFMYSFGSKSGGNWEAGKCGCFYIPTATVSAMSLEDQDGLVAMSLDLTAYVDNDGNGEIYLGFV